ncbi:WbqC family protein [Domibacillus sp.]|uniref:WbqC family protein n=1 Tax=Domibacillus sp. TaxID=1969783 RepID=UPI002810A859|nr:WbqC family protein [Domibacillus sp.]
MKIAIMQPYLFPYIGYFQLVNAVDTFVIFDDVQYKQRGWINRNRILINNQDHLFSFSVKKSSRDTLIKDKFFSDQVNNDKKEFLKSIEHSYSRAPYYQKVISIIEEITLFNEENLSDFITNSLKVICGYLDIETNFIKSSSLSKEEGQVIGADKKIISIARHLGARTYVNLIGGISLYTKEIFHENDLDIYFLKSKDIIYRQFKQEFIPSLSIIDVLMFNSVDEIKIMLNECKLV